MSYQSPPPLPYTFNRLQGKVILITGASSGIGASAAKLFAKEGAKVVASARRRDKLDELVAEIVAEGHTAVATTCDVTNEESIESAVAFAVKKYGRLDGAFNNAGASAIYGPLHEIETEDFDKTINTNLRGVFISIKYEVRAMLKSGGGTIVNNSSVMGLLGAPNNTSYATSKWGLEGITRCAALDYARQGIRVNSIAPGPTRSEIFDRLVPNEESREKMADKVPMNYIAHPEDMARAALFLLSEESRWTTGITFPCEGGLSVG